MVGENPQAAEGQGLSVLATRTAAIVAGSALMGVAGSSLTLSAFNAFFFNMVNGAAGSASPSWTSPDTRRADETQRETPRG